jgi:hypothetical protein
MSLTIRIETTGVVRSGTSSKGNEYHMAQAYLHIPGVQYPQLFDYYCAKQNEVLPVGHYECDVSVSIKDGRPHFEIDPRQARRVNVAPVKAAAQA